jgi:hypothetical protein
VYTREQRLRVLRRHERLERRSMLPTGGVQHAGVDVQKHRGRGVDVLLCDLPAAPQPELCLVELARPDGHPGNRSERRGEYRVILQAIALGQRHGLTAALVRGRDRDQLRREALMRAAGDLQVRSADRLRERGSL